MKLIFRITVPGDYQATDDEIKTHLQSLLETTRLEVIDWTTSERKDDPTNFEERTIHLTCQKHHTDTYAEMDDLTTTWCKWKTDYWLTLTEEDSFHQTRLACHEHISLKSLCFGTLTSPIDYVVHHCKRGVLHANFYHDTRSLEIRAQGKPLDVYILKIKYTSVERLIVYLFEGSFLLFLDLRCPPPAFFKGKRMLTFGDVKREIHGNSNVLMLNIADIELAKQVISRFHFCNNNMPVHYALVRMADRPYPILPEFDLSNFDATYNLHAVLTRKFVVLEQIGENWEEFIKKMEQLCNEENKGLAKALEKIMELLERGTICVYPKAIETLFEHLVKKENQALAQDDVCTTPKNTKLLRKLVLTPTTTLFFPPEFQFNNRILRQFDCDYTLRVSFRDDDLRKLSTVAINSEDSILEQAVRRPMKEGIKIGSRHFELLAWSNSQIRDHGVWMYAQDQEGNNAETIRKWMGDFSGQKSVSKYMARLGQCFSQTEEAIKVPLDEWHVRTDPDIEGGRNPMNGKPYCFSDGIGRISKNLTEKVCQKLSLKRTTPSAFQIRYAGYKGMLALDPTLTDVDIVFRKSMKKFESTSNHLEIVKISQAIPVYLNRPMINIMNQLGVKTEIFLDLQEQMLSTITDILVDDEKAADYLASKVTLRSINRFKEMIKAGIGLTGDPFFRGMLLCLRDRALSDIKRKARLAVDPTEGRNMFGVLDETATLEYGQVFVQYTKNLLGKDSNKEKIIRTGCVLVTKNPCTQPGDIRLLEAIDVPELHHLVDCVAFPQKGQRPHPNEMAGSDLDGDEYSVIWKEDLFFSHNRNPENFPSPIEEVKSLGPFSIEDSITMLSDYIKNDQIGAIGNSHLAISDKFGIEVEVCQEIARKLSLALDYVKTGHLEPLSGREKPHEFPDFMERTERETYSSKRALGDIYRYCKQFEQKTTSLDQEYVQLKMDPDLIYPGWEEFEESAKKTRDKYNSLLQSLLQKYGVQSEVEAMSGAFRSLHQRHSQRHDSADVEKLIVRSVEAIQDYFRKEFNRQLGITEDADTIDLTNFAERTLRKASSWYVVTYSGKSTKFLSFPWVICRELIRLKLRQCPNQPVLYTSMLKILDDQLRSVAMKLPQLNEEAYKDELTHESHSEAVQHIYRLILHWANKRQKCNEENERWILNFILGLLKEHKKKSENEADYVYNENMLIKLCLSFLKKVRDRSLQLPQDMDWLRSYANDTYQVLAYTGNPAMFCPVEELEESKELVELTPVKILAKIIPGSKYEKIKVLESVLKSLATFKEVMIRQTENCLVVSAVGPHKSIRLLQEYLNVDTETLKTNVDEDYKQTWERIAGNS